MADPGRAYLYNQQQQQQQGAGGVHRRSKSWSKAASPQRPGPSMSRQTSAAGQPSLHLVAPAYVPQPPRATSEASPSEGSPLSDRWEAAVGNLEDARVAFDVIARSVEDAVYLDEDAYKQVLPTMQYTVKIQAQQHRINELEQQLEETNERLLVVEHTCQEAQKQAYDLRTELESNAEVFKMHYAELLAKEEELSKLRVIVQALS